MTSDIILLVMIAVVFIMSWLPLNVCNIITDFDPEMLNQFDQSVSHSETNN